MADAEAEEVRLMSRWYGPAVPRELIEPRQKWPFGPLALWVPKNPLEARDLPRFTMIYHIFA